MLPRARRARRWSENRDGTGLAERPAVQGAAQQSRLTAMQFVTGAAPHPALAVERERRRQPTVRLEIDAVALRSYLLVAVQAGARGDRGRLVHAFVRRRQMAVGTG